MPSSFVVPPPPAQMLPQTDHPATPALATPSLAPSRDAILFVAVVQRCPPDDPLACACPTPKSHPLALLHVTTPSPTQPRDRIDAAKAALIKAPSLVFPTDLPLSHPTHSAHLAHHDDRPAEPMSHKPVLLVQPVSRHSSVVPPPSRLPTSPISESPLQSPNPSPGLVSNNVYADRLAKRIDAARTLPLSARAVYDALAEAPQLPAVSPPLPMGTEQVADAVPPLVSRRPSSSFSTSRFGTTRRCVTAGSNDLIPPRRANSLPRRPSTMHPPAKSSASVRPQLRQRQYTAPSPAKLRRVDHRNALLMNRRRVFRMLLLAAKTHVFAFTARDGSRQYVYCRPLSAVHAVVIVATRMHTPVYVSAIERTAAHYAFLVDDTIGFSKCLNNGSHFHDQRPVSSAARALRASASESSHYDYDVLSCPPLVAAELCNVLVKSFGVPCPSPSLPAHLGRRPSSAGSSSNDLMAALERNRYSALHSTSTTTMLPSSTISSLPDSCQEGGPDAAEQDTAESPPAPVSTEKDGWLFQWKERDSHNTMSRPTSSSGSLPWEVAAELPSSDTAGVERVVELADSTLLFRYFPVRSIMSVLVALLEERRVCIVGPDTSVVSRAVLAFVNLMHPFEWPHTIAPILLEDMLPVLGAPVPVLVGLLEEQLPQTRSLELFDVVFADLTTGKVTAIGEVGDLYRHVPRRLRNKIERRLTRTKTACMRQVYRSKSMQSIPTVSNTATSFVQEECDDAGVEKTRSGGSLLWRSRSQQKLYSETTMQNIWLEHGTVVGLDKAMRKFFAELLEDMQPREDEGDNDGTVPASGGGGGFLDGVAGSDHGSKPVGHSGPFAASRRDNDRPALVKAFSETQMYMQWKDGNDCDFSFGLPKAESSKKRAMAKKDGEAEAGEVGDGRDTIDPRHVTSDLDEDIFSGEEGVLSQTEEGGAGRRKRFRSRRNKTKAKSRLKFNSEVEEIFVGSNEVPSDIEGLAWGSKEREDEFFQERPSSSMECMAMDSDGERDSGIASVPKKPWLTLRLPSSSWMMPRDFGLFSSKEASGQVEVVEDFSLDKGLSDVEAFEFGEVVEKDVEDDCVNDEPRSFDGYGRGGRVRGWGLRRMKASVRT